MSKPNSKIVIGRCSYCGDQRELEPDHVVPRALFVNPNQATVIIPACQACNRDKGAGEEDLRDYMVLSQGSTEHPTAQKLIPVVAEAVNKGLSRIGRAASEERKLKPYYTNAGIYLGDAYHIPVHDPEPMYRSLRYMVRGLHFHEYGERFPEDSPHGVIMIPDWEFYPTLGEFARFSSQKTPNILGRKAFWWVAIPTSASDRVIGWVMCFYDGILVLGFTGIQFDDDEDKAIETFQQIIQRKGRRERALKRIVDRRLVHLLPNDLLGLLERLAQKLVW